MARTFEFVLHFDFVRCVTVTVSLNQIIIIYRIIQNQTKNSSSSNLLWIVYSGHCALNNVKCFRIRLVFSYRRSKTTVVLYCIVHLWPISIRAVGGYFITQGTGPFRYSSRIGTRANPVRPLYRRCCQDCRIIRAQGSPVRRRHSNLRFQQCLTIGRAIRTSPSCHWQG